MQKTTITFSALIFFVFIVFSAEGAALNAFCSLTGPEKWWTIKHPFVARRAYRCAMEARTQSRLIVEQQLLDGDSVGGQVDAFRHAFWMARCTQEFGGRKAMVLGKVHEKGNYRSFIRHRTEDGMLPDSVSSAMDLFNNAAGIELAGHDRDLSAEALKMKLIEAIRAGELRIIRKNENGEYLDCAGRAIDLKQYHGVWSIPACLVPSAR